MNKKVVFFGLLLLLLIACQQQQIINQKEPVQNFETEQQRPAFTSEHQPTYTQEQKDTAYKFASEMCTKNESFPLIPLEIFKDYITMEQKKSPTDFSYKDVKNPAELQMGENALMCSMGKDYEKAIMYSDKGLAINPESPYLLYMKGRTEGDLGRMEEGLRDLDAAIKIRPDFSDAYVERGAVKQENGDIQGAKEDYAKAMEIEPSNPWKISGVNPPKQDNNHARTTGSMD